MRSLKCVRVDARDEPSATALLSDGWRPIEWLLQMERETEPFPADPRIRPAHKRWTLPAAIKLGRENMGPNRFIRDRLLDEKFAADVRAKWLRDNLDRLFIYIHEKRVYGFLLGDMDRLDLIVVDSSFRQQGIGRALVKDFISRAWQRRIRTVRLGTQSDNEPAIALYRSLGFKVTGMQQTFHK